MSWGHASYGDLLSRARRGCYGCGERQPRTLGVNLVHVIEIEIQRPANVVLHGHAVQRTATAQAFQLLRSHA